MSGPAFTYRVTRWDSASRSLGLQPGDVVIIEPGGPEPVVLHRELVLTSTLSDLMIKGVLAEFGGSYSAANARLLLDFLHPGLLRPLRAGPHLQLVP